MGENQSQQIAEQYHPQQITENQPQQITIQDQPPQTTNQIPEPIKKKSHPSIIILVILIIGGLGFGIYSLITSNSQTEPMPMNIEKEPNDRAQEKNENKDEGKDENEAVIETILKKIDRTITEKYNTVSTKTYNENIPVEKINEEGLLTDYNKSIGLKYSNMLDVIEPELLSETMRIFTEELDFAAIETHNQYMDPQFRDEELSTICVVTTFHNDETPVGLLISCSHDTWRKTEKDKKLIQDIAKTQQEITSNEVNFMSANADKIIKSDYEQYEIITANLGLKSVTYFRENTESDWIYSFESIGIPKCNIFNPLDIQIFKGKIDCYHNGEQQARKL